MISVFVFSIRKAYMLRASYILSAIILTATFALPCEAKIIQILHTNDLHASLTTAGAPASGEAEFGGWAQIKAKMDSLTQEASAKGISTLRVDAGDFSEGTTYYFPDSGKGVLAAFQSMGYDAATLGNHDWLMGARDLDRTLGEQPFSFPLLSANIKVASTLKNIHQQIVPTTQIIKDGIKIGLMGLSTDEAFYRWITAVNSNKNDMKILPFFDINDRKDPDYTPGLASRLVADLRKQNDIVIALTHIGYGQDQRLAAQTPGIDLIIGGHSHTFLESLQEIDDPEGRSVPIVQTGVNGHSIGRILIDVEPNQRAKVISYELVPVFHQEVQDENVARSIASADQKLESLYGHQQLYEVLGHADNLIVPDDLGPNSFGQFAVDAMKDRLGTQVAIDLGEFHGVTPQAAGVVTRRTLMELYPRKFETAQNGGLYVYRAKIPGIALLFAAKYAVKSGVYLSFSGLTYDVVPARNGDPYSYRAKRIRINGKRVCLFCDYSAAVPESLIRGAYGITSLSKLLFQKGSPSQFTIWNAMESYLKKTGTINTRRPAQKLPWVKGELNLEHFLKSYANPSSDLIQDD